MCVVCYLVLLRPFSRRYVGQVRDEILRRTVGQNLENYCYEPKGGVTAEQVQASGLIAATQPKAFFSREHVTGSLGGIEIELADVSFPILENKLNAMFKRLLWEAPVSRRIPAGDPDKRREMRADRAPGRGKENCWNRRVPTSPAASISVPRGMRWRFWCGDGFWDFGSIL